MYRKLLTGLGLLLVLLLLCVSASADGYPESAHDYESNTDQTWTYTHPTSLTYMKVTFSSDTKFENGWDFLYITDASGNETKYTGDSLAGKTLYFQGNTITLRLTSDGSVNRYGFRITSIAAATQAEYDAPRYTVVNGTITAYQGAVSNLSIPSTVDGQTVTAIGSSVFANNSSLTSVTIPGTVTQIGSNAFNGCAKLKTVTLTDGLAVIGRYAFYQCTALTSITLPDSVTTVDAYAFNGCTSLKTATLSGGLTVIGSDAFHNCAALTSITLPDSVTTLGAYAFYGCTSLKTATLSGGLTVIGSDAFHNCAALTSITLPDSVTTLGAYAFYGCTSLNTAVLSGGLTAVSSDAFKDCTALTSITIPDSVASIGYYAFSGCTSLKTAALSSGLTSIDSGAFKDCTALTSITLPNSVTSLGAYVFSGCASLKTATLSSGLTTVESSTFSGCNALTSITIPNSVTSLGSYVFYECTSLKTAALSNRLTAISNSAFYNCAALTSITLPNSVTSLGSYAFSGCTSLKTATLSSGLTAIESSTFSGCNALASITIPNSVTSISASAFNGCGNLKIRVVRDSFAHQYALEQGIPFIIQGEEEPQPSGTAATVSEKVQQIVAEVIHPGMTDYQKALALHNYLTLHANYDYTYSNYYADGVLLHGTGVCQSYTLAYALLLDAVGISNWRETGDNHTWNVARLDGVWCHIDVTWDDPGEGGYEHCEWFGITDYALEGVRAHERYSRQQTCDDYRISYVYKNGLLGAIVDRWKNEISQKAANGEYDIVITDGMQYPDGIKERMAYQMFCDVGIEVYGTAVKPESRFEFDSNNYTLYVTYDPSVQPAWTFVLPSRLKTVEEEAFMGIQAKTVKIPSGCGAIGGRAFADSAIQAIYIPASVKTIGADAIPAGAAIFTPAGSTAAQWGREKGYTVIETGQ